ncbi:hypothetical protein ABCW43_22310 [Neorhizobium sp. IRAMC:178]|uniref:hypothetical protein n=1 Tax=Neorhizobium tunisiense TaxID=3144793 RepID=UPI0031F618DF
MSALRFLYDCDPGADDALAMLLVLGRPDALEMIALTFGQVLITRRNVIGRG